MNKKLASVCRITKTSALVYLSTLVITALVQTTAFADWRSTGPFGGDAEVIRVVPKMPGFVIAGAHNGLLYLSRNGGAFWTNIPFDGQSSGSLHALEVDPRSADTWYVGMEGDHPWTSGVYKTADAGGTWTLLPGIKGKAVWSLAIWPSNPDIMAAGTADGVYRTSDAGRNWTQISSPDNQELRPVVSLAFDPMNSDVIYAGTTHLPWRTTNGGASWQSIHTGMIDDSDVFSIQVDFHHPAQVFASACSGLYQSEDSAAHWNKLPTPKGAFRTYFVALDPRNSRIVFAGTTEGLLRSEDGGRIWRQVTAQAVRSISFDAQVPQRIFFASATAGLMVSTDGGKTLRETNAGFTNRNFTVLTGAKGVLYASSVFEPGSGGIYRTDNYGLRWQRSAGEPGQDIRLLTAVPDQPGTLFAAGYHGLFKSNDGGKTWNGKTTLSASAGRLTSLLALAHNVLLAGTDQGLFRSTDGIGWQLAAGNTGGINALERSGENTISAMSAHGTFASTDAGVTWKACAQPAAGTIWYGLAFDGGAVAGDERTALAATSMGLFRSTDGCLSWVKATGLLPETVSIVLFHPTHEGEAYAAQGGRVFRSTDRGQNWFPLDDEGRGLSWPASLFILPEAPDRLFALFPRRGVLSNSVEVEAGTPPVRNGLVVRSSR
ncbi:MAG: hypothetical protein ABSG41_01170 [Bryobacteraceae bacterium]|jgi:photosystem II stability/assembly factor-like uncharacterized protein